MSLSAASLRRWRALTALLMLVQSPYAITHGFLLTGTSLNSLQRRRGGAMPSLLMAKPARRSKQRGGPAGAAAGGKKRPAKGKNSDKNANSNSPRKRETDSSNSGVVVPSHKSKAPPWQVLSAKEAKQNVKREKTRREMARQGIDVDDNEDKGTATINGKKSLSEAMLSDVDRQLVNWKRFNPSSVPCGLNFMGAFLGKRLPPRLGVPEIAFLGRSNVGKSSLLNKLAASALSGGSATGADEARVGKTPGATASVNLYAMKGKSKQSKQGGEKVILGMADLPGFGYAKLSKETQASVQECAERYLDKRQELALGILLVDARRVPSDDDRAVLAALYDLGLPIVVVTTKIDKLNKNQVEPAMEVIRDSLGLPDGQPLCVSSVTGEGTKQLWKIIMEACEDKVEELKEKLILQRTSDEQSDELDGAYSTEFDDAGNPILPFDDGEALVYDQGYDWIQDSGVMYDETVVRRDGDGEQLVDGSSNEDEVDSDDTNRNNKESEESFKLKDLKKRLRNMERDGEIF